MSSKAQGSFGVGTKQKSLGVPQLEHSETGSVCLGLRIGRITVRPEKFREKYVTSGKKPAVRRLYPGTVTRPSEYGS